MQVSASWRRAPIIGSTTIDDRATASSPSSPGRRRRRPSALRVSTSVGTEVPATGAPQRNGRDITSSTHPHADGDLTVAADIGCDGRVGAGTLAGDGTVTDGGPHEQQGDHVTETQGWTAPGLEGVRDAFQANFDNGTEVGAAFSGYHRGEKVVDLWGGIADQDTGAPWNEDTIILVFSTTKGMTAIIANKLAQEGRARRRGAGGRVLARVRGQRQAGHPGRLPALAPGRPGVDRRRR